MYKSLSVYVKKTAVEGNSIRRENAQLIMAFELLPRHHN